ncbi:hypothetical protein CSW98_09570 [Vibrio sp. HA2012]|uniref:hypothetical protein n=1 Tax=Vibrio sp. HA2012 TaxID=1971595 RepID=UPI000C2CB02E|nr:hypothetical protein [Vibrio sp. HA2012]PJC86450.1 hypothetical protein CSW98_09570 [Vibrio sp. HA2012]
MKHLLTVTGLGAMVLLQGCSGFDHDVGIQVETAIVSAPVGDIGTRHLRHNTSSNSVSNSVGITESALSAGSVFAYDNPAEQWEVTSVDQQHIAWRSTTGDTKLTTLSTILPPLRWNGDDTIGRRVIRIVSGDLHPLKAGNKFIFHEDVLTTRPPGEYTFRSECDVQGQVTLTIPLGTFDTWQILCKRNGREAFLVNYSEQLANSVRIISVSENSTTPVVRHLVAVSQTQPDNKNRQE